MRSEMSDDELLLPDLALGLHWENVGVSINEGAKRTKSILTDCAGHVYPGEVCAIVGPSGAGAFL